MAIINWYFSYEFWESLLFKMLIKLEKQKYFCLFFSTKHLGAGVHVRVL